LEFRAKLTEGVGALIYCKNTGRYLFLLRSNGSYANTWGLPGGKLDTNEAMDVALLREIREELDGYIKDPELVLIERYVSSNKKFIYHTYFMSVDSEFVPGLNEEHVGYAWLPLSVAPKPLHPGLIRTLNNQSVMNKLKKAESNC
jgi:8-oxo-dGTP pyrophosphatase MutT (NUDIX family)